MESCASAWRLTSRPGHTHGPQLLLQRGVLVDSLVQEAQDSPQALLQPPVLVNRLSQHRQPIGLHAPRQSGCASPTAHESRAQMALLRCGVGGWVGRQAGRQTDGHHRHVMLHR
jgi:hypothetical protein